MMGLMALFKGLDLARIAAYGAVLAVVAGLVWFNGYQRGTAKLYAYQTQIAAEGSRIATRQARVTQSVVTRYVQVKGDTQTITREVEKEVIRYAQTNPAGACLDDDWVRVHNRAADNAGAEAPGRTGPALRTARADDYGLRVSLRIPGVDDRDRELPQAPPLR